MRLMKVRSFLLFLCLAVSPASAETIVVAATNAGNLVPGARIDPGQTISLPDGARLTLLTRDGQMQVVIGPFEGIPAPQSQNTTGTDEEWSAVLALVGDPDARSEVMGASRVTDGEFLVPPSIWHVSIDSSGPRCTQPSEVALWRRNADQAALISVRNSAGRLTDLSWPAETTALPLPAAFAVGGKMVVSIGGELRDLDLAIAPKTLNGAGPGPVFSWLMENKCQRQALALIERLHAGVDFSE